MLQNLERESYYLGDLPIARVPLFVHWSALVLVFMCWGPTAALAHHFESSVLQSFVLMLIALIGGILLHELGHGLTGRAMGAFGITITLWAFGGLCRSTRDSSNLVREIAIVAAGPLVSLALWQGSYWSFQLLAQHAPDVLLDGAQPSLLYQFLKISERINLALLMFNILPIFPLDGGQLVFNGMRLFLRDRLLVRQISLSLAFIGAIGFFCWSTGLFDLMGQPDAVTRWVQHLQDNLYGVVMKVVVLGYLLRNAVQYLG